METYSLAALILGISALSSIFAARVLRLPETIGLMATGLLASMTFLLLGLVFPVLVDGVCQRVLTFDFSAFVLEFALGFLVFAGAFMADTKAMKLDRWPILVFATFGIILSTFIVGGLTFGIVQILGIGEAPFIHCLLFGALISPTDPIAVLAILKTSTVPRSLRADIAGESLLNDGVAVVVFMTILGFASGSVEQDVSVAAISLLFGREVIGGILLGMAFGWLGIRLVRLAGITSIDILISLAMVMTCYALAWEIEVSGPLALVVVGLWFGQALRSSKPDQEALPHLETFWKSVDHILNAVLFTLMGFVLLALSTSFEIHFLFAGILAIPVVLLARAISVALPLPFTKLRWGHPRTTIMILTWGGLRGGISIALALSLEKEISGNLIMHMTYVVVAFSILAQGLSIGTLVREIIPDQSLSAGMD